MGMMKASGTGRELEQLKLLEKLIEEQKRTNELLELLVNNVMAAR